MKNYSLFFKVVVLSFILGNTSIFIYNASANDRAKNLPFVYDPNTKKYFMGGTSKLFLKEGDQSGPVERIEVSVDGSEYHPYGDSIQFKEEGKHTLKFRAINPVNNWSPVQFVEVFVDLTSPTSEAKFTEDRYYKNETGNMYIAVNSSITLTAQDNLSGVSAIEWSWDGIRYTSYTKPITVDTPGHQTLWFRSADRVGNTEIAKKMDFTADGTSPTSAIKFMGGNSKPLVLNGKTFLNDSVSFSIEAQDEISKIRQTWVAIDGEKPQAYIKPIYFLKEGAHTLSYYSVDNVGNKETEKAVTIYTVSSPPRTTATTSGTIVNTGGLNYATKNFQFSLSAQDNVVGLERIEVKIDQEPEFKQYIEPIHFNVLGLHTISYRSVDRANNYEPTQVYTVNVHETPPETGIESAQPLILRDGITYSSSPNVVTFNVSNSPVGVKNTLVSINDANYIPYDKPLTLTADQKVYKISYKSVDKLGNEEKPKTMTVHMIGTTPAVDLFISSGQSREEQVRTNYLEQPSQHSTVQQHTDSNAVAPSVQRAPAATQPGH